MPTIRNLAVGLPVRDGHVLVSDATDPTTGEASHRAVGGGIEFGERADVALRREFAEELGVVLATVQLLGVVENIFGYGGQPGHEIVHVFAVESEGFDAIALDATLRVLDEGSQVRWRRLSTLDRPLYPAGTADLLRSLVGDEVHMPEEVTATDTGGTTLGPSAPALLHIDASPDRPVPTSRCAPAPYGVRKREM